MYYIYATYTNVSLRITQKSLAHQAKIYLKNFCKRYMRSSTSFLSKLMSAILGLDLSSKKVVKVWCDSTIRCLMRHEETHDILLHTASDESAQKTCYEFYGAEPKLCSVIIGKTKEQVQIAAEQFELWLKKRNISPQRLEIWRDALLQLNNSELCKNCGGQYPYDEIEKEWISALEALGCTVHVVSCHTETTCSV
jgi:hypothetical protein